MAYSDKLKDPRWQKKRLEILQRDDFKCRLCKEDKETLHVHHASYEPGKEPWEYPENRYLTLCDHHHSFTHDNRLIVVVDEGELSVFDFIQINPVSIVLFSKIENRKGRWTFDFFTGISLKNKIVALSLLLKFMGDSDVLLYDDDNLDFNYANYIKPFSDDLKSNPDGK